MKFKHDPESGTFYVRFQEGEIPETLESALRNCSITLQEQEHSNADLIRRLYDARDQDDEDAIRSVLSEDVLWHEPDVGGEHTGDLHGPDAVLAMIRDARERTGDTFRLVPCEISANGEHAVALVDWSARRNAETLEGKEVAVYRVRGGRVVEGHFHQDDQGLDRRFWE